MTFTEAAAQVLRLVGKPLHYKEITDVAIEKNLLSHVGKSPEVTMGARLAALVKKGEKDNPLVRVKPGVFALRDWDPATIEKGLADRTPALERLAAQHPSEPEESSSETSSPAPEAAEEGETAAASVLDPAERERAAMAAHATDFFESEDDDDEPIFGREAEEAPAEGGAAQPAGGRRRRRRRRGGRGAPEERVAGGDGLPSYTVSDAPADLPVLGEAEARRDEPRRDEPRRDEARRDEARRDEPRRDEPRRDEARRDEARRDEPRREDRRSSPEAAGAPRRAYEQRENGPRGGYERNGDGGGTPLDELAGRGLADGLAELLGTFDRNRGPVALQTLVDAAERRGRFFGEHAVGQGMLVAAARADNARALGRGERPRFRVGTGRIGLTDWALDGELLRVEREIQQLAERYRESARRSVLRIMQDLPHRALGELVMLVLEHVGFSSLVPVRRPGAHGAELHLSGRLKTPAGEIRTAVVVRRDGREIGRERVTELRGALHHYGPASAAWLVTTGQVLSGAREEAAAPGASPLTVIDGLGLVRLCEEHGVGVIKSEVSLVLPDLDLLDGLRAS
ncbi:MAG TPA: HTH domain-containing protein [Polyangiaceae bacterium]|nr:HTH domain-containing protein [Polyangiaceae bacterium]